MISVVEKPRCEQLKELLIVLAVQIDSKPGARDMASLARQYRETLREIEELEGAEPQDDEISDILTDRESNGKSGAVRKDRTKLSN